MLKVVWGHRRYIWNNAKGELKYRYSGSVLGFLWNILNPLAQIIVYSFVFSKIMPIKFPNITYTLAFTIYICAGLLPWISFSECVLRGVTAFQDNATFLKKLPIPEGVFIAQIAVSAFLNGILALGVLAGVVLLTGGIISWTWLLLPIVFMFYIFFGFGIALILGTLNIFIRDIAQIMGIVMQLWMWLSPIVYLENILPQDFRTFLQYNPIYPYIQAFHQLIVYNQLPNISLWMQMLIYSFIIVFVGALILNNLKKEIRDLI